MVESIGTAVLHFILLSIHIACLDSLAHPYLKAYKAKRLGEYLTAPPLRPGQGVGNFGAVSLFLVHPLVWAKPGPSPSSQIFGLFSGWTVMLVLWTIYMRKQVTNEDQEKPEV
jgi:hypothetical protein